MVLSGGTIDGVKRTGTRAEALRPTPSVMAGAAAIEPRRGRGDSLRVIREFVSGLSGEDPRYEPTALANEVTAHLEAVKADITQIEAYDGSGDATTTRQNIFTRLDNERGWFAEKSGGL